jgi:hypothetical protein
MINDLSYPKKPLEVTTNDEFVSSRLDTWTGEDERDTYSDDADQMLRNLDYDETSNLIASVNSFVDKNDFETSWDDFAAVASHFRKKTGKSLLLAIVDWKKAYRQGPTHMSQWKYLTIKDFENRIWVDTRIAFGGVAGCGTFGWMADAWRDIITSLLGIERVFRWVDDNMFVKEVGDTLDMATVLQITKNMGIQSNEEKFSDWKVEQKYLGFIWNGNDKSVRLPTEKLQERISQVGDLLTLGKSWSKKDVEKLVGQLNHITYIVPNMKCCMWDLYWWIKTWRNPQARRKLPVDARDDLQEWLQTLSEFQPLRIVPDIEPIDLDWAGDASTGFGIGILVGDRWAQFELLEGWETRGLPSDGPKRKIAWLETVAVRLGLRMIADLFPTAGRRFLLFTDNTTTEAAIRNRKSRDKTVNGEWKHIQKGLTALQCDIVANRVESGDNPADDLSRGITKGRELDFEVLINIPSDLSLLLKRHVRTRKDGK